MANILLTADATLGELSATAFNGELAVTTITPLAEATLDGSVCVPGALLTSLASKLPSGATANIRESTRGFGLTVAGATYDLSCEFGPDDFPQLPTDDYKATVGVSATALADALKFVAFAAGGESSGHPELECVCLSVRSNKAEVAALDGHRVAIHPVEGGDGNGQILLPMALVSELLPVLRHAGGDDDAVELRFGDSLLTATIGETTITGRLHAAKFPPYRKLLPSSFSHEYTTDRDELVSAIERTALIANQLQGTIVLAFDSAGKTLTVSTENDRGDAAETLLIDVEMGKGTQVCLHAAYALDALKRLHGETVTFMLPGSPTDPVRITSDAAHADAWQMIMPRIVK